MKGLNRLFILAAGTIIFVVSLLIPVKYVVARYIIMIAGAIIVLAFYFITLLSVIKTTKIPSQRKIFWLVAIICVPVLGNAIYVIFSGMANRRQLVKNNW